MKRKFAAVMLSALAALLLGLSVFFVACEGGTESGGQDTEQGGETGDEEQGDGEETQEPAYTLTYELTGDYYTVTGIESAAEAAEVVIPSSYQGVPVRAVAPHAFWGGDVHYGNRDPGGHCRDRELCLPELHGALLRHDRRRCVRVRNGHFFELYRHP